MDTVYTFNEGLGENIRLLRKRAHLTQEDLAERLDVTTQMVSKLERGRCGTSSRRLVELAKALQCGLVELLEGLEGCV